MAYLAGIHRSQIVTVPIPVKLADRSCVVASTRLLLSHDGDEGIPALGSSDTWLGSLTSSWLQWVAQHALKEG
jgi:hypothetical protein